MKKDICHTYCSDYDCPCHKEKFPIGNEDEVTARMRVGAPPFDDPIEKIVGELLETCASLEHARWSRWYLYQKGNCTEENIRRWDRQAMQDYSELSEREKESDRREVREYLGLLKAKLLEYGDMREREGREKEAEEWKESIRKNMGIERKNIKKISDALN